MNDQILVAYATKYGATAEIAEKIGQILLQAGLRTDVLTVDSVSDMSLYKAVVLGSAVYIGQWRKEAGKFLKANEKVLTKKLVWLFSSGPTGVGDPVALLQDWHFPKALQPIADRIHPHDIAVFHGVVDMNKLNPIEKQMLKSVNAPPGDFRDWDTINAWASSISDVLLQEAS
jgi:menaquinone-dependent protoporphyrinogen oxidase